MVNFENGVTPINDTNLNKMQTELLKAVFPIGSTYITQENTNPNTILGFGTWERLKGRVCLGLDEDDTDLDTIGKTGGEKTHILTVNEMPSHTHGVGIEYTVVSGSDTPRLTSNPNNATCMTSATGNNQPHNNLQPYEVVGYMWIRRA